MYLRCSRMYNETADNYNSDANVDDGSCEYPEPAVGTADS